MSLSERLQAELKTAMRERDELRRETLRMAVASAYDAEKAARRPLSDDEVVEVLGRQAKRRRESIDAYEKAGRADLADRERSELEILVRFLPEQLDEEAVRGLVREVIAEVGASSARDLGRVMGTLAPRTRGRADGRLVSGIVAQELARADLEAHGGRHDEDHR